MSSGDDFTPRLGRPGDAGSAAGRRFSRAIRKRAARLARPRSKRGLSRGRIQRGGAAGRMASFRQTRFSAHRMRRTVVQVYIARASKSGGAAGFAKHAQYLQRDGVDRDGHAGEVYDRDRTGIDADPFVARSQEDRHQFRIMVSHEDGAELGDLKPHTRALMAAAEKDLGTPLDWIAVDHHNTGRPHTHVIIRGRADDGRDLVIAKDYLTKGLRRRASELVTEALGPRRDLEIMRAEQADVVRDRYTGLDRRVFNRARNNALDLEKPTNSGARFDDALARRRLRYLEQLGLARRLSTNQWQLSNDWNETLRQMGRRDDIVRAITAKYRETDIANRVRIYDPSQTKGASLQGRIVGSVPVDELHSRRHLIVEGVDGLTWSIDVGPNPSGSLPGKGSLVEIMPTTPAPKRSDQTIARIAALNDGKWSEALHAENDPSSTKEYRLAHKRRLEALRRAGLVERKADGVWKIGSDYLGRTTQFEARKTGGAQIVHLTSKSLTSMETADAHTWLDRVDASGFAETGFGSEVKRAQVQRLDWLREQGLVAVGEQRLSATAVSSLEARELTRLVKSETETSGRVGGVLDQGRAFSGKFEKIIESHQGRLALVGTETRFALTPMRAKKGSALGRELTVTRKGQSIDWAFGRKRGPSR